MFFRHYLCVCLYTSINAHISIILDDYLENEVNSKTEYMLLVYDVSLRLIHFCQTDIFFRVINIILCIPTYIYQNRYVKPWYYIFINVVKIILFIFNCAVGFFLVIINKLLKLHFEK